MFRCFILVVISLFLACSIISPSFADEKGKLGQMEDDANDSSSSSDDDHSSYHSEDDEDDDDSIIAEFIVNSIRFIFYYGPDENVDVYHGNFLKLGHTPYPYCDDDMYNYDWDYKGQLMRLELQGDYFRESSDLYASGARLKFSPHSMINTEFRYLNLQEKLASTTDEMELYDITLSYNRHRLRQFSLWWGAGLKYMKREKVTGAGTFNVGSEIFLPWKTSLHYEYRFSSFPGTVMHENEIFVNYHINRFKIFSGYRNIRTKNVTIEGLQAGIAVYF